MPVIGKLSRFARKPFPDKWNAIKAQFSKSHTNTALKKLDNDGTGEAVFTTHNIRLADGSFTIPRHDIDVSQHPWFKATKRALTVAFPGGLEGRRIVDLGCLEGGHTTEFARLGMEALGIEVRRSNFNKCLVVKEAVHLPNLNFAHDTVWNLAKYGEFDAVFCCGLLYHLDKPREFIRLASSCCKTICLYQTHFATAWDIEKFNLSPVMENEGLKGRWYKEYAVTSMDELEKMKWSSWENQKSFWLMREEILGSIHDNGFDMVFEQYDCLVPRVSVTEDLTRVSAEISTVTREMTSGYYRTDNRCLFVGVRTGIA